MQKQSIPERIVAGYVRLNHRPQAPSFAMEAQKWHIRQECVRRNLPDPVFYEDEARASAARRPAFEHVLRDVEAGRVQLVMVQTLDRWSRDVLTALDSFRILEQHGTGFVSLAEGFDSTTPEGKLQVAIMSAFVSHYPDVLAQLAGQDTDTKEGDEPPEA